jgi:uncharacterized membrane protein
MAKRTLPELWIVRMARGHARLWFATLVGCIAYAVLPGAWRAVTRVLIAWDVGVVFYLAAVAVMMARSSVADIRKHCALQDEGAFALMVLTVIAALASLGAIFAELSSAGGVEPGPWSYTLAITTVILSWSFIQTMFALHYAHDYYGKGQRASGLNFPGDGEPDYWDFVYFSFVIGMTFQVSDVAVTNKLIRRSVVAHGVLSFFYSTTVVALTVNMAASAL